MADTQYAGILEGNPFIDEIISFDSGPWRRDYRFGRWVKYLATSLKIRNQLRDSSYDLTISMMADKWWALWFLTAPLSVGLFGSSTPGWLGRFYTHALPTPTTPKQHNTDIYLQAVQVLGAPQPFDKRMICCPTDKEAGTARLKLGERAGEEFDPLVAVSPFSTAENRNWPISKYRQLVHWLIESYGATVLMMVGPRDKDRVADLILGLPEEHVLLIDKVSVAEYAALVSSCHLMISGDSSPMHIAAAGGVPYIALFGTTPHDLRAPLVGRGVCVYKHLECAPCDRDTCSNPEFRKCMNLIELSDVQAAVKEMLGQYDCPEH
jgi:ADP-heptose:LPS heptosyltransferase